MKEQFDTYKAVTVKKLTKIIGFTNNHRISLVFIIIGVALSFALLRTRAFLNPGRNETRYGEEKLKINYKSIDYEIVDKLSQTQEDNEKISVDKNLQEGRVDPFSEN